VKILLDTHVFLWFIAGDERLATSWVSEIRDPNNEVYLSVVSVWEAVIKHQNGRLPLPEPPQIYLPLQRERHGIGSVVVDEESVAHLAALPSLHRDPFDRILIAQARRHGFVIATVDEAIRQYEVQTLDIGIAP